MKYRTGKDIADKYGTTRQTVYNWIKEGMPSKKFGGLRRFNEDEVEKWLLERGCGKCQK